MMHDRILHAQGVLAAAGTLIYRGPFRRRASHHGPGLHSIWVMLPVYVTRICTKVCFLPPFMS